MNLDSICKHCRVRIMEEKCPEKRHYSAPRLVREAWKQRVGSFMLGRFYKKHCEVCGKYMAVFDSPKKELEGKNVVLYVCTFTDVPALSRDECDKIGGCYKCPIPKEQIESGIRVHY